MSLLPKSYLDIVVSIEKFNEQNQEFATIATGFLLAIPIGKQDNNGQEYYQIFLVTTRQVFQGQELLHLRFNKGEGSRRYNLPLLQHKNPLWTGHANPAIDLAMIPILADKLKEDGVEFQCITPELLATIDLINTFGISEGNDIFTLGFPLGIAGRVKKYAIVRGGIIARLDEEIVREEHCFLIDAHIFPGNNGGPVFLKPSPATQQNTPIINKSYLLGMICGYLRFQDVAYSTTIPPEPRIVFNENLGLARVLPVDPILTLANSLMGQGKKNFYVIK